MKQLGDHSRTWRPLKNGATIKRPRTGRPLQAAVRSRTGRPLTCGEDLVVPELQHALQWAAKWCILYSKWCILYSKWRILYSKWDDLHLKQNKSYQMMNLFVCKINSDLRAIDAALLWAAFLDATAPSISVLIVGCTKCPLFSGFFQGFSGFFRRRIFIFYHQIWRMASFSVEESSLYIYIIYYQIYIFYMYSFWYKTDVVDVAPHLFSIKPSLC